MDKMFLSIEVAMKKQPRGIEGGEIIAHIGPHDRNEACQIIGCSPLNAEAVPQGDPA